ncbi:PDR/VanB family oxidoreductase [Sinomonas halotolerans]|uniref:PDR/VanB family oxidoreductase n=1 Tax=Sinomonas halotolerans TaxID=1644133 RepID=A0ABU9WZA3_9MICC
MSTGPASYAELEVTRVREEADGVVGLTLTDPLGGELPAWEPGAHAEVVLPNGLVRHYSLCSDPTDRRRWRVAVLREAAGRGGSAFVHDELRPGTKVRARLPRQGFAFGADGPVLFIAGGIGITPLLPMMRAAEGAGIAWRLVYLGRSRARMAFLGEIAALHSAAGGGGRVTVHASGESGPFDLVGLIDGLAAGETVYACGPERLLAALEEHPVLAAEPGRLRTERFAPGNGAPPGPGPQDRAFMVETSDGTEVLVPPGVSILDALDAAGFRTLSSCRSGTCGTCETPVLAGVPDHRDSLLTDDERAAGETMMLCVSRCSGERLVLDL